MWIRSARPVSELPARGLLGLILSSFDSDMIVILDPASLALNWYVILLPCLFMIHHGKHGRKRASHCSILECVRAYMRK